MGIDLLTERIVSLAEAAKVLPAIDGRKPHTTSVWRWCRQGLRGIQLEYLRVGYRIVTSYEALARFAQRLVEADVPKPELKRPDFRPARSHAARERAIKAARESLAADGI
jgi:hypothetical protein